MADAWIDTAYAWVGTDTAWQPVASDQSVDLDTVDLAARPSAATPQPATPADPATARAVWSAKTGAITDHCWTRPDALEVACLARTGTALGSAAIRMVTQETALAVCPVAVVLETAASARAALSSLRPGTGVAAPRMAIKAEGPTASLTTRKAAQTAATSVTSQAASLDVCVQPLASGTARLGRWRFQTSFVTGTRLAAPVATSRVLATGLAMGCSRAMPVATGLTRRTSLTTLFYFGSPLDAGQR